MMTSSKQEKINLNGKFDKFFPEILNSRTNVEEHAHINLLIYFF